MKITVFCGVKLSCWSPVTQLHLTLGQHCCEYLQSHKTLTSPVVLYGHET